MCTTCGCDDVDHDHDHDHPDDSGDRGRQGGEHPHGAGAHRHHHPAGHAKDSSEEPTRILRVERDLLAKNDRLAAVNRRDLTASGIAMFNLIGAPGAGKTALLEALIRAFGTAVRLFVLEGDQATDRDAQRIERAGGRVIQINTGTGCHLDATHVAAGVRGLAPPEGSVVFVENVGNLVCPALFDLGERAKIVAMSVTEGEDKPLKYPHVFRSAALFVLTKADLRRYVEFDEERCLTYARRVNPHLRVVRTSATAGEGIDDLCNWVREEMSLASRRERGAASS